jgi:hypothetical protein
LTAFRDIKDGILLFGKPPPIKFIILEQRGATLASLLIIMKDKQRVLIKEYMAIKMIRKDSITYS